VRDIFIWGWIRLIWGWILGYNKSGFFLFVFVFIFNVNVNGCIRI
jgi:hypothetical protein